MMIGGLPAWRATIDQHACPATSVSGADGVGAVLMGSPTVLINNMMACRLGDIVVEKPGLALGPANPIIMGEPTVEIGEVGMGTPVVVTPIAPLVALAQAMQSAAAEALARASQEGTPFVDPGSGGEGFSGAAGPAE